MINEQELKKKLIERAGFEIPDENIPECAKRNRMYIICPNLTKSLDACVKWLVPKGKIEEIVFMFSANTVSCDIEANLKFYEGHVDVDNLEEAYKKSALALCLAFEKLIDSEVKK